MMRTGAEISVALRSVVAAQRAVTVAIRRCIARAVMRCIAVITRVAVVARRVAAVVQVHARRMVIAGTGAPRTIGAMRAIAVVAAVGRRAVAAASVAAVIATVVAVAVAATDIAFLVGAVRRKVAGAGIGRTLVDVLILLLRVGEPLMGPATAGIAAGISDLRHVYLRHAAGAVTAGHCGGRGHHGNCRDQSRNQMTHYSLLWVFFRWASLKFLRRFLKKVVC